MKKIIFAALIFYSHYVWSYPQFIGYGYSSCMTCHFNGQGGGALNDYGRGVWAAEITSRAAFSKASAEDLAAASGFFGRWESPHWLKPGIKYRGLWVQNQPRSSQAQEKFYHMQLDFNLTSAMTAEEKILLSYTLGYTPNAQMVGTQNLNRYLPREYFIRWTAAEKLWIYLGLMDKPFGIRHADHTAYSKTLTGNTQKDQTEGLLIQKANETWELSAMVFAGQPTYEDSLKDKGFSFWSEKTLSEKSRLGGSILSTTSSSKDRTALALHGRWGLDTGSSLLAEYGVIQNKIKATDITQTGGYGFLESQILLTRGYFFRSQFEMSNAEYKPDSPNNWRVQWGLLMFPFPRLEARADIVHNRTIATLEAPPDTWSLRGQIHVVW